MVAVNGRDYYLFSARKEFSGLALPVFPIHSFDESAKTLSRMNQTFINADAIIEAYQLKTQDYAKKYGDQVMYGGDTGVGGYLTEQATYRKPADNRLWLFALFPTMALCGLVVTWVLIYRKNKKRAVCHT